MINEAVSLNISVPADSNEKVNLEIDYWTAGESVVAMNK